MKEMDRETALDMLQEWITYPQSEIDLARVKDLKQDGDKFQDVYSEGYS